MHEEMLSQQKQQMMTAQSQQMQAGMGQESPQGAQQGMPEPQQKVGLAQQSPTQAAASLRDTTLTSIKQNQQ